MKKILFIRIVSVILLFSVMLMIFLFSCQVARKSGASSGKVAQKICENFYPKYNEKTKAEQKAILNKMDTPLRKLAHISLFFCLGFFAYLSISTCHNLKKSFKFSFSFLLCVLYAASDEIHQLFVKGRGGKFSDVLIDSFGTLLGILLAFLIVEKTNIFKMRKGRKRWTKKI